MYQAVVRAVLALEQTVRRPAAHDPADRRRSRAGRLRRDRPADGRQRHHAVDRLDQQGRRTGHAEGNGGESPAAATTTATTRPPCRASWCRRPRSRPATRASASSARLPCGRCRDWTSPRPRRCWATPGRIPSPKPSRCCLPSPVIRCCAGGGTERARRWPLRPTSRNRWAARWQSWPGYGAFWKRLVRHVARQPRVSPLSRLGAPHRRDRSRSPPNCPPPMASTPTDAKLTATISGPRGKQQTFALDPVAPGRYAATFQRSDGHPCRIRDSRQWRRQRRLAAGSNSDRLHRLSGRTPPAACERRPLAPRRRNHRRRLPSRASLGLRPRWPDRPSRHAAVVLSAACRPAAVRRRRRPAAAEVLNGIAPLGQLMYNLAAKGIIPVSGASSQLVVR